MSSIKLHKEHGLNPTVTACYFCGGEKNEVALLGAAFKDRAPMHMVINREPCDKCKTIMSLGIMIVEMKNGTRDSVDDMSSRTGRIYVIKEEAMMKLLAPGKMRDETLRIRICFMDEETTEKIGLKGAEGTHDINEKGEIFEKEKNEPEDNNG